ncbi:MAG: hypothetical protein ACT4O3_04260 [Elusimicrobiota bacterium]
MKALLVLMTLSLAGAARAGVRLEATAQPQEAFVGDPIRLQVTVHSSSEVAWVSWPAEKTLGSFEVLESSAGAGGAATEGRYLLAAYETGVSTIPPLALSYALADGATRYIQTPPIPVAIKSVLPPDARDIRDIKGAMTDWTKIFLWSLLLAAGGTGGFLLARKFRRDGAAAPPGPPPRPPHEAALEALSALEEALDGPAKTFYSRLSDALRAYVEGRFGIPALDRTTSELFQELRRGNVAPALFPDRDVLETSDLAKFAKLEPAPEERRLDLQKARDYVLRTRPAPEVAEPHAG